MSRLFKTGLILALLASTWSPAGAAAWRTMPTNSVHGSPFLAQAFSPTGASAVYPESSPGQAGRLGIIHLIENVESVRRRELLGFIAGQGITLWGSRWASLRYLEDYATLLDRAKEIGIGRPRHVLFIPWQIIPFSYFAYWTAVPLFLRSTILLLPHRSTYHYLAAMEISQAIFKADPGLIPSYGRDLMMASAALADRLAGSSDGRSFTSARYAVQRFKVGSAVTVAYLWLLAAWASGWARGVVTAPLIPAVLLGGIILWVAGVIRPAMRRWRASGAQPASVYFYGVHYFPVIMVAISLLIGSLHFDARRRLYVRIPAPWAELNKVARAYQEGRRTKGKADPLPGPAFVRLVNPRVVPDGGLTAPGAAKGNSGVNNGLSQDEAPELAQETTHNYFSLKPAESVTETQRLLVGTYAQLRQYFERFPFELPSQKTYFLLEFETKFRQGKWLPSQRLRVEFSEEDSVPMYQKSVKPQDHYFRYGINTISPDIDPKTPPLPPVQKQEIVPSVLGQLRFSA